MINQLKKAIDFFPWIHFTNLKEFFSIDMVCEIIDELTLYPIALTLLSITVTVIYSYFFISQYSLSLSLVISILLHKPVFTSSEIGDSPAFIKREATMHSFSFILLNTNS